MFKEVENWAHKDVITGEGLLPLEVEVFGDPLFAFWSGVHGSEDGVIGRLRAVSNRSFVDRPDIFSNTARVFRANPEAILAGTETFKNVNLNRQFPKKGKITDLRAKQLAEVLGKFPNLKYLFSFHMDPQGLPKWPFYMYDQVPTEEDGDRKFVIGLVEKLKDRIRKATKENPDLGGLFTGIDDPDDPKLGNYIEEGYKWQPVGQAREDSFETWAVHTGKVERAFIFEIPENLSLEGMTQLLNIVFEEFIIPFLEKKLAVTQAT